MLYGSLGQVSPCVCCGELFERDEGYTSMKWFENTIICPECFEREELEIEENERAEVMNDEISNALYEFDKPENWEKISPENRNQIVEVIKAGLKSLDLSAGKERTVCAVLEMLKEEN